MLNGDIVYCIAYIYTIHIIHEHYVNIIIYNKNIIEDFYMLPDRSTNMPKISVLNDSQKCVIRKCK